MQKYLKNHKRAFAMKKREKTRKNEFSECKLKNSKKAIDIIKTL
jgi:hypothetical protein